MLKSNFWALFSLICLCVALVYLMLAGFHLSKSLDPAIAYLGLFLEWFGGAIICGVACSMLAHHETRQQLNRAIRGGKK